jgi:quinol monooxygenase YgiN
VSDQTILVVSRMHGLTGRRDALLETAEQLRAATIQADGCLGFDVLTVPAAAGELVLLLAWRDEAAMREHFRSPAYARYVDAVGDLLARPSDVVVHRVASTTHPVGDLSLDPRRAD